MQTKPSARSGKQTTEKNRLTNVLSTKEQKLRLKQQRLEQLSEEIEKDQKEIHGIKRKISRIDHKLEVSDHAVLRYIERAMEIDVDAIKDMILNDFLIGMYSQMPNNGKFPISPSKPNIKAVIQEDKIVTIIVESKSRK